MSNLGIHLYDRREEGDVADAEWWWIGAAELGDTRAMTSLGNLLYERGDKADAENWWTRAADAGDTRAMFNLGVLLQDRGSERDLAQADELWIRVADSGDSRLGPLARHGKPIRRPR